MVFQYLYRTYRTSLEVQKLKEDLQKKKAEIQKLKSLLEESDEVYTGSEYESDSEVSGSEYEPSESESDSDSEYEPDEEHTSHTVNSRKGRKQHCSYCKDPGHKTTTCYQRSWDMLVRLRLNPDAVKDFAATL